MNTQDKIPEQLLEIVNSHDFEDDGGILISSFALEGDDVKIQFILDSGDTDIPNQTWEIVATSIKEEKISISWDNELSLLDDHYLLWQFTCPSV